jgi:hypothetical protein
LRSIEVNTNGRKTMTRLALALLAAASCAVGGDASSAATINDITNRPNYTLHKGDAVLVNVGIWPYFSENGLTDPNSIFPDTLVITASGEGHGDCQNQFVLGQLICVNYRFRCMAVLPGTPINDATAVYLVDMNAEALANPNDPKGTCYASQSYSSSGKSILTLLAFVAAERQVFTQDIQATRGLIQFLSGGSAAMQPNGTWITFAFQFNPRPTDPQSFTVGGFASKVGVKGAFTTSMNSESYPNPQTGSVVSVSVKRAQ